MGSAHSHHKDREHEMFRTTVDVEDAIADTEAERLMTEREREVEELCRGGLGDHERAEMVSYILGRDPFTSEPYYTTEEVLGWMDRAVSMGGAGVFGQTFNVALLKDLLRVRRVPNAKFRERFVHLRETEGLTPGALGEQMGLTKMGGVGDATRVERRLGLKPETQRYGKHRTVPMFIPYDLAVRFADALKLEYVEVGV